MKKLSLFKSVLLILCVISAVFIFQLTSNMINYSKASAYIDKGDYAKASAMFGKLDGYRDSEVLKEYCDIMAEYDSSSFSSVYHSYRGLMNISDKLDDSSLTNQFTKNITEIETLYNHYNLVLYVK